MSLRHKLQDELKAVTVAALYFGCWIAALLLLKQLVLAEYKISFRHYSLALVGALILSKVVLVLEHVSFGGRMKTWPAGLHVVLRTALYAAGVVCVLILERGFEGRHEHGGFTGAVRAALQSDDADHIWANTLCVGAALLVYNALSVVRCRLGKGGLLRLFIAPLPSNAKGFSASERSI